MKWFLFCFVLFSSNKNDTLFLTYSDVQNYIENNQLKTKPHVEEKKSSQPTTTLDKQQKTITMKLGERRYHDIEISSIRRAIAKRLTYSKTNIPHQYISITSNVDEVLKLRKQMVNDPTAIVKVSVNDFIIKAVSYALRVSLLLIYFVY